MLLSLPKQCTEVRLRVEKPGEVRERKSPSTPVNELASDREEVIEEMMSKADSAFKIRKIE